MTLIKQYVEAMLHQDSVALSKIFSPTAIFVDYCPKDAGQPQLHAYGPEGIDMFFRNRFLFRKFGDHPIPHHQRHPGLLLCRLQRLPHPAPCTIQDFSEDGEIQRMVVRPRLTRGAPLFAANRRTEGPPVFSARGGKGCGGRFSSLCMVPARFLQIFANVPVTVHSLSPFLPLPVRQGRVHSWRKKYPNHLLLFSLDISKKIYDNSQGLRERPKPLWRKRYLPHLQ